MVKSQAIRTFPARICDKFSIAQPKRERMRLFFFKMRDYRRIDGTQRRMAMREGPESIDSQDFRAIRQERATQARAQFSAFEGDILASIKHRMWAWSAGAAVVAVGALLAPQAQQGLANLICALYAVPYLIRQVALQRMKNTWMDVKGDRPAQTSVE